MRGAPADGSDERIARGQIVAPGYAQLRARTLRKLRDRGLKFGGTEVCGRRIDEVADQRGRLGLAHDGIDLCRFRGDQHARTAVRLVFLRSVGIEAVLGE